jgi:MFS family permease
VLSSGFVAGQVIGGVLVSANLFGTSWRPVFLVNVPIGLAVLALVPRVVPADSPAGARRLDLAGLAVAVPAVFLIVLPLMLGHQENWPAWVLACIALGCLLAAVFLYTVWWPPAAATRCSRCRCSGHRGCSPGCWRCSC